MTCMKLLILTECPWSVHGCQTEELEDSSWVVSFNVGLEVEVTDVALGGLSFFSGEHGLGADKVENFEVGADADLCCMTSTNRKGCALRWINCRCKLCRTS